ncbi:unnamed protein product [Rotaria sp. Silwood2]|nr:unnamed protein product [Rotaria sp. Silwood2]
MSDDQINRLDRVNVTPNSISHLVFTSGSTGTPKAVAIRHRNFMDYIQSHVIQMNDNVLQLSNCTFDAHFEDINAALARGAQLSLLKPGGQLNFDYLTKTIDSKEVTYIGAVPSWLSAMGKFLKENSQFQGRMRKVRIWYLGGKSLRIF